MEKLGIEHLNDRQREGITAFTERKDVLERKDVFVSLPTGYGKPVIYALLSYTFDTIRAKSN